MALLDALIVVVVVGALSTLAVWVVKRGPSSSEERMMRHYTQLTIAAARESRKGHTGEANIYAESAQRLLDAWKEKREQLDR
jgi:type II secretory pathway pseudopilin PulG